MARDDFGAGCPICLCEFSPNDQDENPAVLLSCSHCFHARCLESAERCLGVGRRAPPASVRPLASMYRSRRILPAVPQGALPIQDDDGRDRGGANRGRRAPAANRARRARATRLSSPSPGVLLARPRRPRPPTSLPRGRARCLCRPRRATHQRARRRPRHSLRRMRHRRPRVRAPSRRRRRARRPTRRLFPRPSSPGGSSRTAPNANRRRVARRSAARRRPRRNCLRHLHGAARRSDSSRAPPHLLPPLSPAVPASS